MRASGIEAPGARGEFLAVQAASHAPATILHANILHSATASVGLRQGKGGLCRAEIGVKAGEECDRWIMSIIRQGVAGDRGNYGYKRGAGAKKMVRPLSFPSLTTMKAAPLSLVAFFAASAAAIDIGSHSGVSNVHARLHVAHAKMRRESAGKGYKRCKPKVNVNAPAAPAVSSPAPAAPEPAPAEPAPAPAPANNNNNNDNTPKTNNYNNNSSGGSGGVINVKSDCGDIGATRKYDTVSVCNRAHICALSQLRQPGLLGPTAAKPG